MSLLQWCGIIGIFIISVMIVGYINFNEKIKKKILMVMSFIYNLFIGFIDPMVFVLMWAFFSNNPKGRGYSVPAEEAGFNIILGFIILTLYLIIFLPINIFIKKRANISIKSYTIINGISTIIGMAVFFGIYGFKLI